jgi:phosphohistidine phosphatase
MNLYFLRHGKAEPRSFRWRPDSKRPLTREGEDKMAEIACGIQALEVSLDLILTSPYARALRTAEILGKVYGEKKLFETNNLSADAGLEGIIDEINENFASVEQIALVGHEPFLSRLISTLVFGSGASASIEIKKGGFCKLSAEKLSFGKCAVMNWLLTPRQLARIGKRAKAE